MLDKYPLHYKTLQFNIFKKKRFPKSENRGIMNLILASVNFVCFKIMVQTNKEVSAM